MFQRLAGKPVADQLTARTLQRAEALAAKGIQPKLAIVRVGERPDDLSYERGALKRAAASGVTCQVFALPDTSTTQDIATVIESINADDSIHGCLMFRPLPKSVDEKKLCDLLDARKDVDGASAESLGSLFIGTRGWAPCTAQACLEILDHYQIPLDGAHAVVIGRSLVIGKPLASMMLARNATVSICHSHTQSLKAFVRTADIVICATGRARAYDASFFSGEQVVIDVGINVDDEGNLCGDVDYDSASSVVGALTPVPGGVGSVTTSVLMAHVVSAAKTQAAETE